jgi:hypothetical protein
MDDLGLSELEDLPSRENLRASFKPYLDTVRVHVYISYVWTCKYFNHTCVRAYVCAYMLELDASPSREKLARHGKML